MNSQNRMPRKCMEENRIVRMFAKKKAETAKAFIAFLTAGDSSAHATLNHMQALEAGGVDLIELGMPFSDPMADGPVIQRSSQRALKAGMNLLGCLDLVQKFRKKSELPLLLMGYFNPIFHFGIKKFVKQAQEKGVDALLIVDLPPEEAAELESECRQAGMALIFLLAPTSDQKRIDLVAQHASGFVYFVSMTGITGASLDAKHPIDQQVKKIRKRLKVPMAIGFGIKDPQGAQKLAPLADAVVVGSAFVELIEKNPPKKAAMALQIMATRMKKAIS